MQVRDTDKDWNELAKQDAYWAVLSHPRFSHAENDPKALKDFFESGETWLDGVVSTIKAKLDPNFSPQAALDFGCGVGRLLVPMARYCPKVIGIDIADKMREICAQNLTARRLKDFVLLKTTAELREQDISLDWINSFIVFQHIPPSKALPLLNDMLGRLRTGGKVSLHFTFAKDDRMLEWSMRQVHYYRMWEDTLHVLSEKPAVEEAVQSVYDHDLNSVLMSLIRFGVTQLFLTHEDHGGQHGFMIYGMKTR